MKRALGISREALWSAVAPATAFKRVRLNAGPAFGQMAGVELVSDLRVLQSGGWRHRTPKRFARNAYEGFA